MDKHTAILPVSVFRGGRVILHLIYGMVQAAIYPHLDQTGQRRTMKSWSRQLLAILNIGICIDGPQMARGESGCLMVANHISWLDIFVLNAIHPSLFIAKSEVRDWPLIGWLSRRCGTIFIERALRRNASATNTRISQLLKQGAYIGLFPEGTTTDGMQVGHFHSALFQPAIDAGITTCPIALQYQHQDGSTSLAAAFIGNTSLVQSIWRILRVPRLYASVVFAPAIPAAKENRRMLARNAQTAITREIRLLNAKRHAAVRQTDPEYPQSLLSPQSAYALLVDPGLNQLPK